MAESARRLLDSKSTTLSGSGAGSVTFGPTRPNTRWHVTRITVQTSTHVLEPEARVYHGTADRANFVSGTRSGSLDTDSELDEHLYPGETITVAWTGGDSGATAIVTYAGEEISGV